MSLSTDGWSSRAGKAYLGILLHFVDANTAEQHKFLLCVHHKTTGSTADAQRAIIDSYIGEYNIRRDRIVSMATDAENTMLRMVRDMGLFHAKCTSHGLHNAVVHALTVRFGLQLVRVLLFRSHVAEKCGVLENAELFPCSGHAA